MIEKRYILTFETIVNADDLWGAVNIGTENIKEI